MYAQTPKIHYNSIMDSAYPSPSLLYFPDVGSIGVYKGWKMLDKINGTRYNE